MGTTLLHSVAHGCGSSYNLRGGGTGGAQGARAPPVFMGEVNKKSSEKFPLFDLDAIMHPQFLAPCAIPKLGFVSWWCHFLAHEFHPGAYGMTGCAI